MPIPLRLIRFLYKTAQCPVEPSILQTQPQLITLTQLPETGCPPEPVMMHIEPGFAHGPLSPPLPPLTCFISSLLNMPLMLLKRDLFSFMILDFSLDIYRNHAPAFKRHVFKSACSFTFSRSIIIWFNQAYILSLTVDINQAAGNR